MRPVIKKWIAALRSGKYQQGRQFLRLGDKYCCLGVLCEVEGLEAKLLTTRYMYDGCDKILPRSIETKYGLSRDMMGQLASKNDVGWTFEEIADYIEQNEEELFT